MERSPRISARKVVYTEPTVIVYGAFESPIPRLAYLFEGQAGLLEHWRFVVDARSGTVIETISQVKNANANGRGTDQAGTTQQLNLWEQNGRYSMVDTTKPMFQTSSVSQLPNRGQGVITIYDANTEKVDDVNFSAGIVNSASANSGWLPDAVGASWGLSVTYDYFMDRHGRDSLDGKGANLYAIVRYGKNEANAYFLPATKTMVFGDQATRFVEVTGHELAHGVTDASGNGGVLEYRFQPGALNESMSDIFGLMVKNYAGQQQLDWKVRLFTGERDEVIRDFINPSSVSGGLGPLPPR